MPKNPNLNPNIMTDMTYPIIVLRIPHQFPAEAWVLWDHLDEADFLTECPECTDEHDDLDEAACCDAHSGRVFRDLEEARAFRESYDGHQWPAVRAALDTALEEIEAA